MEGEKSIRGIFLKHTCSQDFQSALTLLFRRLEEKQNISRQGISLPAQGHSSPQTGSGMEIMAAGVHHPAVFGADLMIP